MPPAKPFRLTKRQRKLAEDNIGLVGVFLGAAKYQAYIRILGQQDSSQIASMAICRAAFGYDKGRGMAFGTYADHWVRAYLGRAATSAGASLMRCSEVRTPCGRLGLRRVYRIPSSDVPDRHGQPNPAVVASAKIDAETALRRLAPIERKVVRLRAKDFSFPEIGARLGFSPQRAWQYYKVAVSKAQTGRRAHRTQQGRWVA